MNTKFKVESVRIVWEDDNEPELIGCYVKVVVSYPVIINSRRLQEFCSGGLWGIDPDIDELSKAEIEVEQLFDLAHHLYQFGIDISVDELKTLAK